MTLEEIEARWSNVLGVLRLLPNGMLDSFPDAPIDTAWLIGKVRELDAELAKPCHGCGHKCGEWCR